MTRQWFRSPKALILIPVLLVLLVAVACGSAEEPPTSVPATTSAPEAKAATTAPDPVSTGGGVPTPTRPVFVSTVVPTSRSTPVSQSQTGELATNHLVFLFSQQTRQGVMDCDVTGSASSQHRPAVEYLLDPSRFNGEIEPQLATEWTFSDDARTWNFKLKKGVEFQFGFGEFTADDVVNSLNYYTNPDCKASYSDYFRNNPKPIPEIINDHEITFRMDARPELIFDYWISGYRGLPITSKAQWDTGCPNAPEGYGNAGGDHLVGYCVAGEETVVKAPARTGPYQLVSFEKGIGWQYERAFDDHWRVNPDFDELEIRIIKEAATRLAAMLAREAHLGTIDRAIMQEALDDGLDVAESQVSSVIGDLVFGGMYFDKNLASSYDPNVPWATQTEAGRKVRMAMNKAIDRDAIRDNIFDGQGEFGRVARFTDAFEGGYNPDWEDSWEELYGYDPEKARALLAEAGFPNGFNVPLISYTMSGIPEMRDYVEAVAGMWENIGLTTEIREMEFSAWREKYRGVETNCCVFPFRSYSAPPHPTVHFAYSQERFMRFYTSDTVTENIVAALNSLDVDEQNRRWHAVTDEIFNEVGTIPLLSLSVQVVIDPEVVAEYTYLGPYGGQFTDLEHIKGVRK